ncbi:MAG: cytochrome P450 [Pseudomonadales bacterium]
MAEPALSLENLFTPEFIADPYPTYRYLREHHPVMRLPGTDLWALTRWDDIQAGLKEKQLGHSDSEESLAEIERNAAFKSLSNTMLLKNPPDHMRLRGLVAKTFTARRLESMRTRIRAIANELIDAMIESTHGDLVLGFTHPLPVIVICDLLGIPESDRSRFTEGSQVSGRIIDPTPMSDEELADANQRTLESNAYFEALCEERRLHPQDDLITALVQSETEHGKLSKEELTANISLLFGAGHETTVNLMGNALLALYRNRSQLELLKSDLSRMPNAVEEFLRYDSSVQLTARNTLAEVDVGCERIPKGHEVLFLLGAANRDPEVFEEPDRLDITRKDVKPMSFGGGIHLCLGAPLARMEAAEALPVLLTRLPELELDEIDNPTWKQTITLRGPADLPAHW